jgi:hypothetical protein
MREDQVVIWYTSVHVTQSVQVLTPDDPFGTCEEPVVLGAIRDGING